MKKQLSFLLLSFVFFSCSLKYDEMISVEDKIPEFVFTDLSLTRYEDYSKKVELKASELEQYKGSSESYVKNVDFTSYDDDKELATEGHCGLLMLDTDKEFYELYESIRLFSKSKEATVYAESLRWNSKNEQLISGRSSNVKIQKEDITIFGSGFSASGVSGDFSFTGTVSGSIDTGE